MPTKRKQTLSKPSDGVISIHINRKISKLFSIPLSKYIDPNTATIISGLIGIVSAVAFGFQYFILGGILFQFASIFGGVDGEIARLKNKTSQFGDFLDTVTDRTSDLIVYVGMGVGLYNVMGIDGAIVVGLLGCGTYLITIVSEKYRSAYKKDYPKREWEPLFALVTSGRDARIFYISVAAVLTVIDVRILYYVILGVGLLMYANFIYRVYKIGRQASE